MPRNVTCIKSIDVAGGEKFQIWKANTYESMKNEIPTDNLAVGSSSTMTNSAVDLYQWDGTDWIKADKL